MCYQASCKPKVDHPQITSPPDVDFYAWTRQQAALCRDGKVHELGLPNLAEEIESLGQGDRHAFISHLHKLVMHLPEEEG